MPVELWVILIVFSLVTLVAYAWAARKTDRQQASARDILARTDLQQEVGDRQQHLNEEIQRREIEILARWEALLSRLEAAAASWDRENTTRRG